MKNSQDSLFVKVGSGIILLLAIVFLVILLVYGADIYLHQIGRPGLCGIDPAPCTHFLQVFK